MQSALEILHCPPPTSTFVPLAQHQAQTPASFYDAPPVLYYHAAHCKLLASKRDLHTFSLFKSDSKAGNQEVLLDDVDVCVTSKKLYIYFTTHSSGVAIPYPAISLHAIQKIRLPGAPESDDMVQGLYMQLVLSAGDDDNQENGGDDDDDEDMYDAGDSIIMTIIPPSQSLSTTENEQETEDKKTPTQSLYAALSACSDLHPDPTPNGDGDGNSGDEDEQQGDGVPNFPIYNMPPSSGLADSHLYQAGLVQEGAAAGLPPPMPGSGGWITAENAHEFFDEEGNWKGRGDDLGPGAGVKREGEGEGEGKEDEETKWRKTGQ